MKTKLHKSKKADATLNKVGAIVILVILLAFSIYYMTKNLNSNDSPIAKFTYNLFKSADYELECGLYSMKVIIVPEVMRDLAKLNYKLEEEGQFNSVTGEISISAWQNLEDRGSACEDQTKYKDDKFCILRNELVKVTNEKDEDNLRLLVLEQFDDLLPVQGQIDRLESLYDWYDEPYKYVCPTQ